jgi:carbon-monoxide dehydrogenase large subunit
LSGEAGRFIGQSVQRREDPRLLTGRGSYVDDIHRPGLLQGAFVRSPHARARICSVDTDEARQAAGVVGVYTSLDLEAVGRPGIVAGREGPRFPPLARDVVLFVGDPVVLVVAESRAQAEDAAELVSVDYEPLGPVVTIDDALDSGQPVVHPGDDSNIAAQASSTPCPELDDAFAQAAYVFSETISQHRYLACPMETRGVVAEWQALPRKMTIWISTQGPHSARDHFAALLDLPTHEVRVIAGDVGGAFGQKITVGREEAAVVLAARLAGRPIKWIEDRVENLVSAPHAREERGELAVAVDGEGHILGMRLDHVENVGAYGAILASDLAMRLITGPYKVAAAEGRTRRVRSHTSRRLAYRGPWLFESLAREVMIDVTARRLGIDPVELRRRNLLGAADLPHTMPSGTVLDRVTPRETLDQAMAILDYDAFRAEQALRRTQDRYIGLGVSMFVEPTAMAATGLGGTDAVTLRMDTSGKIQALTGVNSQGHSVETTMVQVIADRLGVPIEDVVLVRGDTDTVPLGATTGGSRNAVFGGGAALKAAEELRLRIIEIAADQMEAAPADLEVSGGRVTVRGTPSRSMTISEIATLAYYQPGRMTQGDPLGMEVTARFTPSGGITWSNACHACTCEVDVVTGKVTLLRYIVSEDCGIMINPRVVEGQICGGVVQGIGGVLLEAFRYDEEGNPLTTTFMDYLLPTAPDVPAIEYGHIETPSQHPGGWKGMGEGGAIAAPAAVVNAVNDALSPLGVEFTAQPLSPAVIVAALDSADTARPFEPADQAQGPILRKPFV